MRQSVAKQLFCTSVHLSRYWQTLLYISVDTNKCNYAEKLPILETGKAFLGIGLSAIEKRGPDDVIKAPGTWFRVGEGFRTSFLVRLGFFLDHTTTTPVYNCAVVSTVDFCILFFLGYCNVDSGTNN